jgi:hypothetical protein
VDLPLPVVTAAQGRIHRARRHCLMFGSQASPNCLMFGSQASPKCLMFGSQASPKCLMIPLRRRRWNSRAR